MTTSVDPSIKKNEASIYIIKSRDGNDHQQDWRHGLINFNEVNLTHCMHASAMCDVMETQHKALATASVLRVSHDPICLLLAPRRRGDGGGEMRQLRNEPS
jgi:hypothetical protein